VTSALQLPADGGAWLDIAPTSQGCQHKSHRRNLTRGDVRVLSGRIPKNTPKTKGSNTVTAAVMGLMGYKPSVR
jgi:hypothetical protein